MITLPNNIVDEAKSLQTGIERGQFNTNALLSFLSKISAAGKPKKKKPLSKKQEALRAHITEGLLKGRITKFKFYE